MGSDLFPSWPPLDGLLSTQFAYIVAFRFNGPPPAYEDFYKELKAYDAWFSYTPNFWIILTRVPLVDVAASLRSKIRTTDWLIVMPAKGPVDGWLPKRAWDWLNNNLQREW
jgi:hypothetical protein